MDGRTHEWSRRALDRESARLIRNVSRTNGRMREHEHDDTNYVVGTLVDNMP